MRASDNPSSRADLARGALLALMALGVLVLLFGVYQIVDARRILSSPQEINMPPPAALGGADSLGAQAALAALPLEAMQKHAAAERQETRGLFLAGAGLIGVGVGWLGYDALTRRRKRLAAGAME